MLRVTIREKLVQGIRVIRNHAPLNHEYLTPATHFVLSGTLLRFQIVKKVLM
jgi:hypothetical protein